jgi:hypothetical protein
MLTKSIDHDNAIDVVQFEIVTPDGEVRTANAYKNKDLFWALRGGGPGFGVRIPTSVLWLHLC